MQRFPQNDSIGSRTLRAALPLFRIPRARSVERHQSRRSASAALSLILAILLIAGSASLPLRHAYAAEASYDPRELGLVSETRDQAPWGMCWAFAGMAALES